MKNFLYPKKNPTSIDHLDVEISKTNDYGQKKYKNIDCWIGITSEAIDGNYFFLTKDKHSSRSGKNIGIITSEKWERRFSPPSLFEYIVMSVLACSLYFLNYDLMEN